MHTTDCLFARTALTCCVCWTPRLHVWGTTSAAGGHLKSRGQSPACCVHAATPHGTSVVLPRWSHVCLAVLLHYCVCLLCPFGLVCCAAGCSAGGQSTVVTPQASCSNGQCNDGGGWVLMAASCCFPLSPLAARQVVPGVLCQLCELCVLTRVFFSCVPLHGGADKVWCAAYVACVSPAWPRQPVCPATTTCTCMHSCVCPVCLRVLCRACGLRLGGFGWWVWCDWLGGCIANSMLCFRCNIAFASCSD